MRMLILTAVMLAGCTFTPQGVRESKISETLTSPGKLSSVALCVTRGFDEQLKTQNNLRIDEASGTGEMIATDQGTLLGGSTGAMYVVDFRRIESGTEVVYYLRGDIITREHARNRIRGIVNRCG